MIYVRDDDVLISSSGFDDPFKKFKQVHRWICETDKLLHVPTILVTEIQEFPDCISFIKEEAAAGRMRPQIHGYKHIDYGKLSASEVINHLNMCKDFMWEKLDVRATTWYTPWGANSPELRMAAYEAKLNLVDCSDLNKLNGRHGLIQEAKEGKNLETLFAEKEIFYHWWQGGLRLKRVVEILKYGSIEEAKKFNKGLFDEVAN